MAKRRNYVTIDGSSIKELVHPDHDPVSGVSLAEATVAPGGRTYAHVHTLSEEIYYTLDGGGVLYIGGQKFDMSPGDAHLIKPGQEHMVVANAGAPLRFLCVCSPPYAHADTQLRGNVET